MRSIRIQITAITIAAILSSILLVFGASYAVIQSETNQNSADMMNLITRDTKKSLEKYFESIEQSVEIAANIAVENLDSVFLVECGAVRTESEPISQTDEQAAALDEYLEKYCGRIQEFFSGVADYTHGVSAYYYCISPEISQENHGFFYMKMGKTGFIEQEHLDAEQLGPADLLDSTWYEAAVEKGRPAWVGPYRAEPARELWICSYFVPIYKAGMLIGVMGMDIPCDTLIAQVDSVRVYDRGFVCLLDENQRVIYHPDAPIGSDLNDLGLDVRTEMLREDSSGDRLIRYTAEGKERLMSFSTLSNNMKLVSIALADEINAPWIRLIEMILMIAVAVIIFNVILILLAMKVITNPLKQLTAASKRLANADYDVDLNYRGSNEIGTLTTAFKQMRDQIRHYIDDLNHQIYHDRLTDLPNMRYFFRLARDERARLHSEGRQVSMLYFDIIGLGYYNRQYSFEMGDRLIVSFAGILARHFGDHRVCRMNGGHFAAVTDEESSERLLAAVLEDCETAIGSERLSVRAGVYPDRLESVDVNIACDRAKLACDQNRGEFSSSVTYYDETMLRKSEIHRYVINNLDKALDEGWIRVYYQPIIRTSAGKICDEEALARWIDPQMGSLSPADFIPALEESKLIWRLDLYVVDQVLKKMKRQKEAGLYLVPQSINLSRMDFESCDVVEEIRRRVDDAGITRSMITIEITESIIGRDFEFMREQIGRFRQLGFPVWMDDFGSGYSTLDVLHQIRFDLIKFDMRFMERFNEGEESRIILTELMNMAIGLGMETVCEGVEQQEQVEFLREIGCTRIQGYYYGRPVPFEKILTLSKDGSSLQFENPEEADYFASVGRINLYDMAIVANESDDTFNQYFNTLPMSIMEVNGTKVKYNRCNRSYRDFMERTLHVAYSTKELDITGHPGGTGAMFLKGVVQCSQDGKRMIMDEKVDEDTMVHTLLRRVAVNPVTGTTAVAVAVLAVIREGTGTGTNYGQMARALAADYVDLYYVSLDTEKFIQYSPDAEHEDLVVERHGEDFFANGRKDALQRFYEADQESFIKAFTRENVIRALDNEGQFRVTYRLMMDGEPTYVDMKAVRLPADRSHIIVGVTNVDVQMRQKEAMSRMQAEKVLFSRLSALLQDFICIYTVDAETGHYIEYQTNSEYAGIGVPAEGDDFFAHSVAEGERLVCPDDLEKYQTLLTRDNIMKEVRENGVYSFIYRLFLSGKPHYVRLKAVQVEEQDRSLLIIGVNNIDTQVRREQDYIRKLSSARSKVHLDTLTGVKDRSSYDNMSEYLSEQIREGQEVRYAILLCRISELPLVNETKGRQEGDRLIRDVCGQICETFKHSPVFRVAGDQFAVIAQGHDLEYIDSLTEELRKNCSAQALTVAIGVAKYDGHESVAAVFARADR